MNDALVKLVALDAAGQTNAVERLMLKRAKPIDPSFLVLESGVWDFHSVYVLRVGISTYVWQAYNRIQVYYGIAGM